MSDYFILTGSGRTGTRFLTKHLNNSDVAEVRHDEFLPINHEKAFARWRAAEAPVIGAVSGTARYYLKEIYEEFRPKIVFLWREPVALVRSHAEMQIQAMRPKRDEHECIEWPFPHESPSLYLRRLASIIFGDLESALSLCTSYEIPFYHAFMDKYTTREGLIEMARFLGFDIDPQDVTPTNSMPFFDAIIKRSDFDEGTEEHVRSLISSLEEVSNGYFRSLQGPSCINPTD
jgi:hypothetical protein